MQTQEIEISKIEAGEHAQRFGIDEESMSELVGSVKRLGLLQPVIVRANGDGFLVVGGHRRFEACKRCGLPSVPCVLEEGNEEYLREVTFAENFFRRDLSPVELAVGIAAEVSGGRMSIEQIAVGFRRSVDWVKRQVALTTWPEDILEIVHNKSVSVMAAANLAQVDEPTYRAFLIRNAVEGGASARTTASWLAGWKMSSAGEQAEAMQEDSGEVPIVPAAPQGVCLCCRGMEPMDGMSYVPLCVSCVREMNNRSGEMQPR